MDVLLIQSLIFVVALGALLKASDWFVDSAEKIGLSLGISPFVIGVTIVAFGTSLPELASSIVAVLQDDSKIVLGNVVGSNITNIVLVLGLVAFVSKRVPVDFKNMDLTLLIGSAFFLWFALYEGGGGEPKFELWEAIIFLVCLVMFLVNTFSGNDGKNEDNPKATWKDYGLLILAGAGVWLGAKFTIDAIQIVCAEYDISSGFIAQTVVALGTSLPEVVVSLTAAKKGQSGMAVGNVIGSNVFNTYAVMGIARLFGDLTVESSIMSFSLPLMLFLTLFLAFMTLTSRITRWEGGLLLIFYLFFLVRSVMML